MQARASTALCALALAAVACNKFDADLGGASASSPHPTSVEPGSNVAIPTTVTIRGDNFIVRTTQSVPGGTPTVDPPLDQQYHAWLDGVELEAVTWQDSSTLQATVPGGLSVGKKTLVVENAFGNRGQLDGAYEVLAGSALIATIAATPSTVSFGQAITLTLTVTNAGGADLTGVTPAAPTISSTNGATAELSSGPTPATVATLAPGASRDFTWVYTPTAPGTLDVSASASGEDASSHAAVTSNAPSASVTIQAGAGLSVPLALSPPTASVGQTITMVMTVTNDGDAGVNNVTPGSPTVTTSDTGAATLATGPTPTSVGFLSPGESATFTWTFTATAAGHLTFSASASGRDANSGATVSGNTTATNAVLVQAAPTLGGVMNAPATVSTNQAFTLTLTFTKGGTAPANVTAVTNPAGCVSPTPATLADVQTGQTITWSCNSPVAPESLSLTSTVSWVDANDPGTTLTFTPAPASVAVVAGASLAGVMSAPATVSTSQAFALTLTFTKGGTPQANVTAVTNPAGCANPTPATLTDVQTGQTITWSCIAPATEQSLPLTSTVSWVDANDPGTTLTFTPAPASVAVVAPPTLTGTMSAPATVSTSQAFTLTLTFTKGGTPQANVTAVTNPAGCVNPTPATLTDVQTGQTITWSCTAPATAQTLSLTSTVSWVDANIPGTTLTFTPAPASVAVVAGASLTGVMSAPATVSTSQAFTLTLTFTKGGTPQANVTAVTNPAGCVNPTPATLTDVQTGQTITWSCTAPATAQTLSLTSTVSWVDANDPGTTLTFTPAPASVAVVAGASLTGTMSAPATVSTDQAFTLTLTFTKGGTAQANVTAVTSPAGCLNPTPATLTDVQTGQTITWSCTAPATAQTLSLTSTVSWVDANIPGTTLTFTPAPASVTVVAPPTLTGTMSAPATVSTSQAFTLTLTFTKVGTAPANVTAVTSPAGCLNPTPATLTDVQTGQTITWSCTAPATAQTLSLTSTVSWVDANDPGTTLTFTPAPASVAVVAPPTLTGTMSAPATVSTSQAFTLTLTFTKVGTAPANVTAVTNPSGCVNPTPATRTDVQTGQTITWSCTAPATAQTLSLTSTVSWVDANNPGTTLTFTPDPAPVAVVAAASLTVTTFAANPTANVGQAINVTLTLRNDGGATANVSSVGTSIVPGVGASCTAASPPPAQTIAGGASLTFTWTCSSTRVGLHTLHATVTATDANSGASVSPTVPGISVTIQNPAALTATIAATTANGGENVTLTLTVTNTGGATANDVTPGTPAQGGTGAASIATAPAASSIPGGGQASFVWTYTATAAGSITFTVGATGTDANSGATVTAAPVTSAPVAIVPPAALSASIEATPATVSVGQTITVTLTVTNSAGTGAASATNVVPSAPTLDPSSGATFADGPSPASVATLAAGANATFTWHYTAAAAGGLTFSASATGTDAINPSLHPSSNIATSPAVAVQAAAALTATDIAATPEAGSVILTLTVTNSGEATANAVGPAAGMPIVTGTGAATLATPPAPFDLGAGATNTLTWIYTVTAAGTLTFSAAASGTDANSGVSVTSNTLTTVEVPVTALSAPQALAATRSASEAVLVATDPFGDGTPAAFVNAYQGGAWVGPSRDGQRLVRLDPSGSAAPSSAALALGVDVGPTPASTWPADPRANALGAPGCTAGVGCGPDEAGGGLILAGTMGGLEWLGLSGVSAAGSRYLYATSSSANPLDFAWVDLLAAFEAASTTSWSSVPSAALFVPGAADRLYLGYAGPGSSHGPLLFALLALPAGPGFDAVPGMDVLDLAAVAMPGVAGTAGAPGITALANLQGILYVAHQGGLVRATTATPSSAATTPDDWAQATPSAAAWNAKTPVPLPGTAGLSPRDRAVPALAAFGACGEGPCVFAVRNVRGSPAQPAVVPQLWRCSPTAGPARCAPGDWSLAAPNTSGDTLLTQLGDETNGAATVLVATAKWLYLGFDNGSTGVQLYRAAIAPQSIADFEGRDGCAAGTAGCQGLGGNGFGDPTVARVFDAKALTFGERTSLWVTAGDGVGPVRVYRIDDTATASATAEPRPVPVAAGRAAGGCSTGGANAGALLAALGLALLRRRSGGRAPRELHVLARGDGHDHPSMNAPSMLHVEP